MQLINHIETMKLPIEHIARKLHNVGIIVANSHITSVI